MHKFGRTREGYAFPDETIAAVWEKASAIAGEDPAVIRRDACGARIARLQYGEHTALGWEIDHIQPISQGGTDSFANLQPLHWKNNRYKADDWPQWVCVLSDEMTPTPQTMLDVVPAGPLG